MVRRVLVVRGDIHKVDPLRDMTCNLLLACGQVQDCCRQHVAIHTACVQAQRAWTLLQPPAGIVTEDHVVMAIVDLRPLGPVLIVLVVSHPPAAVLGLDELTHSEQILQALLTQRHLHKKQARRRQQTRDDICAAGQQGE